MKNILISGGSDGLGKELAKKLSVNNHVTILAHNLEKLAKVAKEINCDFIEADVTDYVSVANAVKTFVAKNQKIDVLINNAGIWTEGDLEDNDPDMIKEILNVNTLGTIFLSKAVIPSMKSAKAGRIINIISQDGVECKEKHSVYSASKWAITGFTKCLQKDLSKFHIGVTGIFPGMLKTSLFKKQGVKRNLDHALDLSEISSLVEFVINLSPDTLLPEISIKNINNSTNMDDSNYSANDLDLNPDMMTTQSGVPSLAPTATVTTTTVTSDPLSSVSSQPKIIDITPGVSNEIHPSKVEDITPIEISSTVLPPSETITTVTHEVPEVLETTIESQIVPEPLVVTPPDTSVIDITPSISTTTVTETNETAPIEPEVQTTQIISEDNLPHLVDYVASEPTSTTVTETVTTSTSPDSVIVETPVDTSVVTTTTTSASPTTASVEVELPVIAPTSPLAEDPDLVKINK